MLELTYLNNVIEVHLSGYTNDNVSYLLIMNQNVPFIPRGITNLFKNLRAIDHASSQLASISAIDLQQFPRLEYLGLFRNDLLSLDGDLFIFNPLLKVLSFTENRIRNIGYDLLTSLNDLEYLSLSNNFCINQRAETRAAVIELIAQLPILCPPLDATTSVSTTASSTMSTATTSGYTISTKAFTELPIERCSCKRKTKQTSKSKKCIRRQKF